MSALSKYRILELAEGVAGEYCGKLLADFGIEVIKLEKPGSGSATRRLEPFAKGAAAPENSGLFAFLNTNKKSVALDLASEQGRSTLAKFLPRVDAVIDDHDAAWLKAAGLDEATVLKSHPGLVACSITPFGLEPPEELAHAEDITVFHMSGWGYHTPSAPDLSKPPLKGAGRFVVSYESGITAALCVISSLYERETTKRGRFIDISKQEVMASRVDYVLAQMVAGDMDVSAKRTAFDLGGPAAIFPCKDGYVYAWLSEPPHWEALRQILGNPDWMKEFPERWLERAVTPERIETTRRHMAEWLMTVGKDEAAEIAQKRGLTLVPLNDAKDLIASPQYQFRRYFTEVTHPILGAALYPTVPYKMSASPAKITSPAPILGQHTDEALSGLLSRSSGHG